MAARSAPRTGVIRRPLPPAPSQVQQHARRPRPAGLTDDIIAAAQDTQRRFGVPASLTLAQWALESGWGKSTPFGSNNPFGIKARPGEPFVPSMTTEVDGHGRPYRTRASFRKYASLGEAFADHARVLLEPAYERARSTRTTDEYADALTGVYGRDPDYGKKLKAIMHQHDLQAFDQPRR